MRLLYNEGNKIYGPFKKPYQLNSRTNTDPSTTKDCELNKDYIINTADNPYNLPNFDSITFVSSTLSCPGVFLNTPEEKKPFSFNSKWGNNSENINYQIMGWVKYPKEMLSYVASYYGETVRFAGLSFTYGDTFDQFINSTTENKFGPGISEMNLEDDNFALSSSVPQKFKESNYYTNWFHVAYMIKKGILFTYINGNLILKQPYRTQIDLNTPVSVGVGQLGNDFVTLRSITKVTFFGWEYEPEATLPENGFDPMKVGTFLTDTGSIKPTKKSITPLEIDGTINTSGKTTPNEIDGKIDITKDTNKEIDGTINIEPNTVIPDTPTDNTSGNNGKDNIDYISNSYVQII